MKQLARIIVSFVTAAVLYYVVFIAVSLAWYDLADANPKIGPSDLDVPEILFHLVTTGIAALATGLVGGGILTRSWAGTGLVVAGTIAVTATFVAIYVLSFDGEPDQLPFLPAISVVTAVILGVAVRHRWDPASPPVE